MTSHDDHLDNDLFEEFSNESLEDELFSSSEEKKNSSSHSNLIVVAVLIAVVAGIAYLLFDGFSSETYFYEVDKAMASPDAIVGQTVRVKGVVEPGSVVGQEGELGRTFRITENGKSMKVTYDKAMPDTFKEGIDVVVHGKVDKDLTLVADEVMVKCPSRYEGSPPDKHPSNIPMRKTT